MDADATLRNNLFALFRNTTKTIEKGRPYCLSSGNSWSPIVSVSIDLTHSVYRFVAMGFVTDVITIAREIRYSSSLRTTEGSFARVPRQFPPRLVNNRPRQLNRGSTSVYSEKNSSESMLPTHAREQAFERKA